jgi:hypothetical protein
VCARCRVFLFSCLFFLSVRYSTNRQSIIDAKAKRLEKGVRKALQRAHAVRKDPCNNHRSTSNDPFSTTERAERQGRSRKGWPEGTLDGARVQAWRSHGRTTDAKGGSRTTATGNVRAALPPPPPANQKRIVRGTGLAAFPFLAHRCYCYPWKTDR